MAISAQLLTTLGGGKTWSKYFSGKDDFTTTVGESGKAYAVLMNFTRATTTKAKLMLNETPASVSGGDLRLGSYSGPLTIHYYSEGDKTTANIFIMETNAI